MKPAEMRDRLAYIHAIASGAVYYASDFGRVCTIERASDPRAYMRTELRKHGQELVGPTRKRKRGSK